MNESHWFLIRCHYLRINPKILFNNFQKNLFEIFTLLKNSNMNWTFQYENYYNWIKRLYSKTNSSPHPFELFESKNYCVHSFVSKFYYFSSSFLNELFLKIDLKRSSQKLSRHFCWKPQQNSPSPRITFYKKTVISSWSHFLCLNKFLIKPLSNKYKRDTFIKEFWKKKKKKKICFLWEIFSGRVGWSCDLKAWGHKVISQKVTQEEVV